MNKDDICARIPHAGRMCLLERVQHWDETAIHCLATSHRDADNPLRSRDGLSAVCGIEYAAQAMAVHAGLRVAGVASKPAAGMLASVRDLRLAVATLDDVGGDLHIHALRLSGDDTGFIYEFNIKADDDALMSGRIVIKLLETLV